MSQPVGENARNLGLRGLQAYQAGQLREAIDLTRRAILLDPTIPALHANLASALNGAGDHDESIRICEHALRAWPTDLLILINLGNAYLGKREYEPAVAVYQRALMVAPDEFRVLNNLGHTFRQLRRSDEAIECLRRAVAASPNLPETRVNLGNALKDQARLEEAVASFTEAIRMAPKREDFLSALLYIRSFDPNLTPKQLFSAHTAWGERFADPLRDPRPHDNLCDPNRRLRVGYVSPDFCNQVLGLFTEPLLSHHDRSRFEIVCYSDVVAPDKVTARMQAHADHWRATRSLSHAQLAELVRQDRVDILIDMTNHMGNNRLLAFARKPAAVQISFPHPFTTGMKAMDYVITDAHLDPPDQTPLHREQLIRLPETYLCYPEPVNSPPVAPLPSLSIGQMTFISANNFCKINTRVLRVWSQILSNLPDARLIVRIDGGAPHNAFVPTWFADHDVDPSRVSFEDQLPRDQYLHLYDRADVCLDPFPYAGYTTSLDALWMGVPVVTLAGETALGRLGVSILRNLDLPELIAPTPERYVEIATNLARNPDRLSSLRSTMRDRMRQSPLMDHARFARNVESTYLAAWERWCKRAG